MNKNLIIGLVVLVLLLVGGFFFMANNQVEDSTQESTDNIIVDDVEPTTEVEDEESMVEDDEMEEEDDSDSTNVESSNTESIEISMTGSDYEFDPETFTVEAGQEVTVTLTSGDLMHDFVLEDMDVRTEIIEAGDSDSVTFTAPEEPGEYTYYCSVGNHRAMGMEGTMIVE